MRKDRYEPPFALLGAAAILKRADLPGFRESLETWVLVPPSVRGAIAILVPVSEFVVAGLWLLAIARPLVLKLALVMLLGFTLAYAAHWVFVGAPECSFLGQLVRYESNKRSAESLIVRNTVLMSVLSAALFVLPGHSPLKRREVTADADA